MVDIEFDAKDIVHARIDRRRKIPVTSLLMARGMDGEEILDTIYTKSLYQRDGEGLGACRSSRMRSRAEDSVRHDRRDTGEVVVESGKKLTPRLLRQLQEKGLKALKATDDDLYGNYLAEDVVNFETGEIYLEAVTRSTRRRFRHPFAGFDEIPVLDIDHINIGAYIRNTLVGRQEREPSRTRCSTSTASCVRVSRRPWIRPKPWFNALFFDAERYDLSAVGRREDEHAPRFWTFRTRFARCARKTSWPWSKMLVELRGRQGRDRRHRQSRQPSRPLGRRVDGEPVSPGSPAHGTCDQGTHVLDRDRHRDAQDLINAKPAAAAVREFFGSSQLSQFMDQVNPLSESP